MKIVFDTNIYVSEALVGGLAEQIIHAATTARFRIFVSAYILDEYQRVLTEHLDFSSRLATLGRQRIVRRAELIDPSPSRHEVPDDAADSPILNCAVESGADYLVTNDRHLLKLHPYESLRIVSMQDFADWLINEGLVQRH